MRTLTFDEIRAMKGNGASMRHVLKSFIDKGATVSLVDESLGEVIERFFQVEYQGLRIPLRAYDLKFYSAFNSFLAHTIAIDKLKTAHLLGVYDLPHPATQLASSEQANERFLQENTKVVVKPLTGSHGDGITTNVQDIDTLNRALDTARSIDSNVLLQQQLEGDDYRLLFVDYVFTAAVKRLPASIVGDGKLSVRQIVEANNRRLQKQIIGVRAGQVQEEDIKGSTSITPLQEISNVYGEDFLNSIPQAGERVTVLQKANISLGGEMHDVTDRVNQELISQLEGLLRAVDMPLCGVDVFSRDIGSPPSAGDSYIIELNDAPGLRLHELPTRGQPRLVCTEAAEALIKYYKGIAKTVKK